MTTAIALLLGNLFSRKQVPAADSSLKLQPEFEIYLPAESEIADGAHELQLLRRGTFEECDEHIQSNFQLARRRDEVLMRSTGKMIASS